MFKSVSAGSREELLKNLNEVNPAPSNIIDVVSHEGLLIAFYYE